ncbi:hypothetical protein B0H19DRAFT_1247615 [Mycena capillaripes]|nr:hypothetical protein B0H19DRAFT_1247615 [Mycena capillaripes]
MPPAIPASLQPACSSSLLPLTLECPAEPDMAPVIAGTFLRILLGLDSEGSTEREYIQNSGSAVPPPKAAVPRAMPEIHRPRRPLSPPPPAPLTRMFSTLTQTSA